MVSKSVFVSAFSYIFNEAGIYVFQDNLFPSQITIVGVVQENEKCSDTDQNVKAATFQSLGSVGIESKVVKVQPDWGFVVGSFTVILLFIFGFVGLIKYMHEANSSQNKLKVKDGKQTSIYFAKEKELLDAEMGKTKWYNCLCRKIRQLTENKVENYEEKDITYKDLESILSDFKC